MTPIGERNVSDVDRLPHVTSLTFAAMPGPELVAALDLEGICVASGSACSAGTEEPSPVIATMLGTQRARHTLRISLGENTTAEQIDTVIQALFRILDSSAAARTRA